MIKHLAIRLRGKFCLAYIIIYPMMIHIFLLISIVKKFHCTSVDSNNNIITTITVNTTTKERLKRKRFMEK